MSAAQLKPRIVVSPVSDGWAALAAEVIGQTILEIIAMRGICHVMLTGGNSAERLYVHWAKTPALPLERLRFFIGDERCVPCDHEDSNYALVMSTLLAKGIPAGCSVTRMRGESADQESAAKAYEELIPEVIDALLLGMGADGHIASLFPHSPALRANLRSVVPVTGPNPPYDRLTITPKVIDSARSVFVLATCAEKGSVLMEALKSSADFMALPCA
jgi:6-phosphogluconolactonase